MIVGKSGSGVSALIGFVCIELENKGLKLLKIAPNSLMQILVALALQLLLYAEDDKFPTSPKLQREVSETLKYENSIIVIDEANRLSVAVRSWLEEMYENGRFFYWVRNLLWREIFFSNCR